MCVSSDRLIKNLFLNIRQMGGIVNKINLRSVDDHQGRFVEVIKELIIGVTQLLEVVARNMFFIGPAAFLMLLINLSTVLCR